MSEPIDCGTPDEIDAMNRVIQLEDGIRAVRDQWRGDDKCWLDLFKLFALLPEGFTPPARDATVDLENCKKFIERCHQPGPEYVSPQVRIGELEECLKECVGVMDILFKYGDTSLQSLHKRAKKLIG